MFKAYQKMIDLYILMNRKRVKHFLFLKYLNIINYFYDTTNFKFVIDNFILNPRNINKHAQKQV